MFDAMNAKSETSTQQEACANLLYHIGTMPEYKEVFVNVSKKFDLIKKPKLDPYVTFAI